MNGAESLVRTLVGCGVETCFANPGTSEMHIVQALDRVAGIHSILVLFEGVATGAADGYARMRDAPAATLLHCGPGFANGIANLHNARRAASGIVNCVGDQATHHRPLDAPLTADTEGWARGASAWVRTATRPETVGLDAAQAVQAARAGRVATLILPADCCWGDGGVAAAALPAVAADPVPSETVASVAAVLRRGEPCVIVLGQRALRAAPLAAANRIAAATGATLLAQMTNGRIERGRGRAPIARTPYLIDLALQAFADKRHVVLVGAPPPVGFFAYEGKPGSLVPAGASLHVLARPDHDPLAVLSALAAAVGCRPGDETPAQTDRQQVPAQPAIGPVSSKAFGQSLAALLPEQAIVVDEGITFVRDAYLATAGASPHDWLQVTGGAIGDGLPLATGAAVACPGRRVVSLEGDGSAAYTVQALWTQARERLDVTTIIFANRTYAILLSEFAALGNAPPGPARGLMDLADPALDWVRIARGFGVEAARAETMEQYNALFARSVTTPGPFLIELAS